MSAQRSIEIAKFDELDETWVQTGGLWTRCVFIGDKNSPDAPVGIAIRADRDIGDFLAGRKAFGTTTMLVVLSGAVMHDGRWMAPGDIYMAPANEMSGDLVFGGEGGVIFIMFDSRSGIVPKFEDPKDQENFDKLLRKDVEEVASGRVEKSVAILPLRDTYTKNRAIVYKSVDEVAKYRAETGTDW